MKILIRESTGGDCYEAAGRYMLNTGQDNNNLTLVHGEVEGQGSLDGVQFGHAWIEDGDNVIDVSNGKQIKVPKIVYYQLGNISKINNLHKYNWSEAMKKMMKVKHWGPWDLKTSTGK